MDRTYRSIPTHPWASNPHQPHFWPCPTPTAPINSAPSSQWCAIFTSRCDSPRGWCVVHCTSTEPIRYKDQYSTQQIVLPSRIEEAEKKRHTTVITGWCFLAALSAATTFTKLYTSNQLGSIIIISG